MTINITAVDDGGVTAVIDNNAGINQVNEDATAGTVVGITGFATDPDPEDTVSYSLDDDAGGLFQIDATTGVVTTTGDPGDDGDTPTIIIKATSSDGTSTTETFTINVVDADDDYATVHESALSTGSKQDETVFDGNTEVGQTAGKGTAIATGNLIANDGGATFTSLAGETVVGSIHTVVGAYGTLVYDDATDDYTYTLNASASHNYSESINQDFASNIEGWSTGGGASYDSGGDRLKIDRNEDTTQTFDFGAAKAGQTVKIEFDLTREGGWEPGSDSFEITANGTQISNDNYDDGTERISFEVVLDASGQVKVDLETHTSFHAEEAFMDNFVILEQSPVELSMVDKFTYTTNIGTADLNISIIDDNPIGIDIVAEAPEIIQDKFYIGITLDVSGSMTEADAGGVIYLDDGSSTTRLQLAKDAIKTLAAQYFSQSDDVVIEFSSFGSGSTHIGQFTSLAAFEAAVDGIAFGSGTNYEAGLDEVRNAMEANPAILGDADRKLITYFLSDGAPTLGNVNAGIDRWDTFLTANPTLDSYSVIVGTGISDTSIMDSIHNVDRDSSGTSDGTVVVPDLTYLAAELLSTVPSSFGGSVVVADGVNNLNFGADGGFVQAVTFMIDTTANNIPDTAVTFTYNPVLNEITNNSGGSIPTVTGSNIITLDGSNGFVYGKVIFDMTDGQYNYFVGGIATEGSSFDINFVAQDGDGDLTAGNTLTINVVDGKPVANDDTDTLSGLETFLEGNVILGIGTDGGVALGAGATSFAQAGEGVDNALDNAKVSAINFHGDTLSLETAHTSATHIAADGTNYTYEVITEDYSGTAVVTGDIVDNGGNSSVDHWYFTHDGGPLTIDVLARNIDVLGTGISDLDSAIFLYSVDGSGSVTGSIGNNNNGAAGADGSTSNRDSYLNLPALSAGTYMLAIGESTLSNTEALGTSDYPNNSPVNGPSGSYQITFTGDSNITGTPPQDPGANATIVNNGLEAVQNINIINNDDGSILTMNQDGYYKYTPPSLTVPTLGANVNTGTLNNISDATNSNLTITSNVGVISYTGSGIAVNSDAPDDGKIDDNERVFIEFNATAYQFGVQDIQLRASDLTGSEVFIITFYHIDGHELGQVIKQDNALENISANYSNIGSISVQVDSRTEARIREIRFNPILENAAPNAHESEVVGYTLKDEDGDISSATLTLSTVDNTFVDNDANSIEIGTAGNDYIAGLAGNDTLTGNAGHDIILGGEGDDILYGNAGKDTLTGGVGVDTLHGGDDDDILKGGEGGDTLYGGTGSDTLKGEEGDDTLQGGTGNDTLQGGEGNDTLDGGAGNDLLEGGIGDDTILGGTGIDTILGGRGDDILTGGTGGDIFKWIANEQGSALNPAKDSITDFSSVDGDKLDLSDLLQGEAGNPISDYITIETGEFSGDATMDTRINIDTNAGAFFKTTQLIVIEGVDLTAGGTKTIDDLIADGTIVVDI